MSFGDWLTEGLLREYPLRAGEYTPDSSRAFAHCFRKQPQAVRAPLKAWAGLRGGLGSPAIRHVGSKLDQP